MDQARDMLDLREIVVGLHPRLIGPTTSINGVFLGPFWYYFNVIPFSLGSGDPAFLVYWMVLWYLATGILIFITLKKDSPLFAFIASIVFLMTPGLFFSSRYSWSANPMPLFTVFYFLALFKFISKQTSRRSFLVGLIAGLSMQIEAAFGVLFFPFVIISYLIYKIKPKHFLLSGLAFFLTLIPQILFELRHNFIMTKTFFGELGGQSAILGEKLSFYERTINHWDSFVGISGGLTDFNKLINILLITSALSFLAFRNFKNKIHKSEKVLFVLSTLFLIWAFVFYLLYPHPLKGWYLLGLFIPYIFILTLLIVELLSYKKNWITGLAAIALITSFVLTITNQIRFIPKPFDRSTDQSTLRNELEVIDWVYSRAEGKGFKAYNYIPSVYDFPYQYIYWWYGTKTYGYQPDTLTYLDNVPEYIPNNDKFLDKRKKATEKDKIFLIIEPDSEQQSRRAAWLGNFEKYCLKETKKFLWNSEVQIRENCNK